MTTGIVVAHFADLCLKKQAESVQSIKANTKSFWVTSVPFVQGKTISYKDDRHEIYNITYRWLACVINPMRQSRSNFI